MNAIDLDEVRSWARDAGAVARQYFNHTVSRRKPDRSLVTEADIAIERMLVQRISARYPDHGIIGEEQTRHQLDREFTWALDPIDGTGAFVGGLPTWGISIGLLRQGMPYSGVVFLPLLDDCYWVGPGGIAHLNDQPIHVAAPRDWDSQDWIATPSNSHRRFTIDFAGKTRSLGCTVASFCYVARGSAIGALFTQAAIWDIAASLAILYAAGGVAIGLSGAPIDPSQMLDGQTMPEPLIAGEPSHVQALRSVIHIR